MATPKKKPLTQEQKDARNLRNRQRRREKSRAAGKPFPVPEMNVTKEPRVLETSVASDFADSKATQRSKHAD